MNRKYIYIILFAIVILAAVLRLWQLGSVPPSPDWDEAALGYDAYSILLTGKDEFGKFLPVVLRSFDDYKPALYAYLAIPSVAIFGLSTFAVRLPSAIFGIISVIATYFLVKELFSFSSKNLRPNTQELIAVFSAFFMAISPWSIQFSRVAFESNVGDALNILAALFLVKGVRKPIFLPFAAISAGLSIYVYQSEKVFTPLLVLVLALIFIKPILKLPRRYLFAAILAGLVIVSPMIHNIVTDKSALLRAKGTSIFNYQTELLKDDVAKLEKDRESNDKLGLVLDNRRVVYAKAIIEGYISHFDLNWLFIRGDISRHHAPGVGLLYLFELPLILLGMYYLIFGNFDKKTKLAIFSWFLLAPLPASITTGVPHAVRTLNFLPIWQIFTALGLISFLIWIKGQDLGRKTYDIRKGLIVLVLTSYVLLASFNFLYYLNQYFVQLNYYTSQDWQYGYQQAVDESISLGNKYEKIVVSDVQPLDKSYMFFLFYLKYPPLEYQKVGEKSSGSFVSHHSFGKYIFRPINWQEDSGAKGVLYIGKPEEIPQSAAIKTIYNLNGTPAIRIAGT